MLIIAQILALASVATSTHESSRNWLPVTRQQSGAVSIDPNSVNRTGDVVDVWLRLDLFHPSSLSIEYELDHWAIDCNAMTVETIATFQYDRKGTVRLGTSRPAYYPERAAITPNSAGFEVYRLLCG